MIQGKLGHGVVSSNSSPDNWTRISLSLGQPSLAGVGGAGQTSQF
jgi:hypothetical protein